MASLRFLLWALSIQYGGFFASYIDSLLITRAVPVDPYSRWLNGVFIDPFSRWLNGVFIDPFSRKREKVPVGRMRVV